LKPVDSLRIALVSLVVLASAAGAAFGGVMLDKVVAVVNNEAVTWSELYRAMEFELSGQMQAMSDEQKRAVFKAREASILEDMINKTLQLQEADRLGITASDEDVDGAIQGIRKKYSLDDAALRAALKAEGFTLEQYREKLREQLAIGRLVDREVRNKIIITDDDVKEYTSQNGDFLRLRQIFLKAPDGEAGEEALSKKLSEVLGKLEAGEDFSAVASEYSEGPAAGNGGDLGYLRKGQLAPEFLDALKQMKPGDVSAPFRSDRGVHIIKLEKNRDVRETIMEKRFEAAYRSWLKGLREKSFIDVRL
jgi:peptidyl-prolyl cis-trans isomerase SurA